MKSTGKSDAPSVALSSAPVFVLPSRLLMLVLAVVSLSSSFSSDSSALLRRVDMSVMFLAWVANKDLS